ncbi:hypothetical protein ACOMHN_036501 [Nucella lapillus]
MSLTSPCRSQVKVSPVTPVTTPQSTTHTNSQAGPSNVLPGMSVDQRLIQASDKRGKHMGTQPDTDCTWVLQGIHITHISCWGLLREDNLP